MHLYIGAYNKMCIYTVSHKSEYTPHILSQQQPCAQED